MRNLLILVVLVTGCATDSSDAILLGQWGGDGLGLTATATHVTVALACGTGTHPASAPMDEHGGFEFETTVHEFYGDYEIYLSGRASGKFLEVELYTDFGRPGNAAERHLLVSGVPPDFTDFVCLGAAR